ncbi:MAG: hypothetical protein LLG13_07820 [Bacteroidales bacterium]|nr:hypothetical protein [Bacteroidales bacterium]
MINRLFLRILFAFLPFSLLPESSWSQDTDYQNIFGDNWKKAASFEKENRNWIEPLLTQNHIPYPVAIAIIFPELIRYSALRDKMEITLLKTLYINLGETYANFSIGQFQMKPSFAEMIREKAPAVIGRRSQIVFKNRSEYDDIKDFRQSIVSDLEDPEIQLKYLIVFMKICEKNYRINRKDEAFRIKFLATAYNYGFNKSSEQIENMMGKKYFNTALFRTDNYCYSEVSLFWYNHHQTDK